MVCTAHALLVLSNLRSIFSIGYPLPYLTSVAALTWAVVAPAVRAYRVAANARLPVLANPYLSTPLLVGKGLGFAALAALAVVAITLTGPGYPAPAPSRLPQTVWLAGAPGKAAYPLGVTSPTLCWVLPCGGLLWPKCRCRVGGFYCLLLHIT